ncbi:hypothetical protein [Nostoc sp. ChiQUE01b]|uniref:hypothetical protein n=1 Tax=Nostoc sp. ChiQUE01b TaxID=3075376 RepID=UPI002AD1EE3C|nr:hypothetical protein [Nostoc sp. ChiQUE01b]MDZ8263688.1 hypothetical protein [Nostoc sp. ChiQUE01b]
MSEFLVNAGFLGNTNQNRPSVAGIPRTGFMLLKIGITECVRPMLQLPHEAAVAIAVRCTLWQ